MEFEKYTTMKALLSIIIEKNLNGEAYAWLIDKATRLAADKDNYQLNLAFTAIPRKTGKREVIVEESDAKEINAHLPGFTIDKWTIDRLCRVWLLLQLDAADEEKYVGSIENLFLQAEMNEQVALYSSLPLLAYPEAWKLRCAAGVRTNIGPVLEAIMYHNPYPASYLDQAAWNQLVMKAFFSDKKVNHIIGLDARANQNLANILFDYVEERWAAHRLVNPQIWRLTGRFMDEAHFYMLEKLFKQDNETDRQAAALACAGSPFEKAKILLDQYPEYKDAIVEKRLNWQTIAEKE